MGQDGRNSACFIREIVPVGNQALLNPDDVSFDIRIVIMKEDGIIINLSATADSTAIFWKMGERRIAASNDRQFRVGVIYMSAHQKPDRIHIEDGQPG